MCDVRLPLLPRIHWTYNPLCAVLGRRSDQGKSVWNGKKAICIPSNWRATAPWLFHHVATVNYVKNKSTLVLVEVGGPANEQDAKRRQTCKAAHPENFQMWRAYLKFVQRIMYNQKCKEPGVKQHPLLPHFSVALESTPFTCR